MPKTVITECKKAVAFFLEDFTFKIIPDLRFSATFLNFKLYLKKAIGLGNPLRCGQVYDTDVCDDGLVWTQFLSLSASPSRS